MTGDLNRFIGDGFSTTIHQRETTSLSIAGMIGIETITKAQIVYFIDGHTVPVDTPAMAARAIARLERMQAAGFAVPQLGVFHGCDSNRLEDSLTTLQAVDGPAMIGGKLIQDPDICPACGQPFDASGGKPVEGAEYICQACVAFRRAAEAGPSTKCRHDRFTAMKGRPETARCDDCGEPPDPADYSRITIRFADTIGDMLG